MQGFSEQKKGGREAPWCFRWVVLGQSLSFRAFILRPTRMDKITQLAISMRCTTVTAPQNPSAFRHVCSATLTPTVELGNHHSHSTVSGCFFGGMEPVCALKTMTASVVSRAQAVCVIAS